MFCKYCGREIDQRTLTRLTEQKSEPVLCSKCKQPLDKAEICGGFWGLIAHSEGMEEADRIRNNPTVMVDEYGRPVRNIPPARRRAIPGATEADREWAKMILGGDYASANSRQTQTGPVPPAARMSGQQQTQIRGSGTRNDMELWITRAAVLLLGAALIISLLFPRRTKADKDKGDSSPDTAVTTFTPGDEDTDGAEGKEGEGKEGIEGTEGSGTGPSGKTSEEPKDGSEPEDTGEPKNGKEPEDAEEPKDVDGLIEQGKIQQNSTENEELANKEKLTEEEGFTEKEETSGASSGMGENNEAGQRENSGGPGRIWQRQ